MENLPQNLNVHTLSPAQRYVELSEGDRIAKTEETKVWVFVRDLIKKTCYEAGPGHDKNFDEEGNELSRQASLFTRDLKKLYPRNTLPEVAEAFSLGVRSKLGNWYGLGVITYCLWMDKFNELEDRKNALMLKSKQDALKELPAKKDLSDKDKEGIATRAYMQCFDIYSSTGRIQDYGNGVFKWLERTGKINLTHEEKLAIYKEAEQRENDRLNSQRKTAQDNIDKMAVQRIDAEINRIVEGEPEFVKVTARHIALARHFDKLIDESSKKQKV